MWWRGPIASSLHSEIDIHACMYHVCVYTPRPNWLQETTCDPPHHQQRRLLPHFQSLLCLLSIDGDSLVTHACHVMSCHLCSLHAMLCHDCIPSPLMCLSRSIYLSIYWSDCRSSMLSSFLSIGAVLWETFELKDKFFKPSTSIWFDLMGSEANVCRCSRWVSCAYIDTVCLLWHRCWPALILVAIIMLCVCVLS